MYPAGRCPGKPRIRKSCAVSANARLRRRPSAEKLVYGLEGNNPAQIPEKHLKATPIFRARVHHSDLDVARASGRERSAKQPSRLIVSSAQGQSDDHYAVARLKSLLGLLSQSFPMGLPRKASLANVGGTMIGRRRPDVEVSALPSAGLKLPNPVHQKSGPTEMFMASRR